MSSSPHFLLLSHGSHGIPWHLASPERFAIRGAETNLCAANPSDPIPKMAEEAFLVQQCKLGNKLVNDG